jgi:hypothetical protein
MNEHVVPGPISRRLTARDLPVPLVGQLERGIHVDHDSAVAKELVLYEVADAKAADRFAGINAHGLRVAAALPNESVDTL